MLDRILSVLPRGNQKNPVVYQRMIDTINFRLDIQKNKFLLGHPVQTSGIELIRFLMLNIDLEEILSYSSDIDRFTNIIDFVESTFRGAFDPVYKGRIERGLFTARDGGQNIPEFIMNTEYINKFDEYPFDKPYVEWKKLRAVRIIHHDSLELVSDLHNWAIKFTKDIPSYMLFSIDIRTLVFKWVKYVEYCRYIDQEPDDREFLKTSEIIHWHDDLFNIWLINIINQYLQLRADNEENNQPGFTAYIDPFIIRDEQVQYAFDDLGKFIDLAKDGAVRVQDILDTRWINNRTVSEMIKEQQEQVALPEIRQYRWLDIIRWMPYLRMILLLNKFYPKVGLTKMIVERGRDIMNRDLKFQNLSNNLLTSEAKKRLAISLQEINDLVNES